VHKAKNKNDAFSEDTLKYLTLDLKWGVTESKVDQRIKRRAFSSSPL
jgi:hypothetical protein